MFKLKFTEEVVLQYQRLSSADDYFENEPNYSVVDDAIKSWFNKLLSAMSPEELNSQRERKIDLVCDRYMDDYLDEFRLAFLDKRLYSFFSDYHFFFKHADKFECYADCNTKSSMNDANIIYETGEQDDRESLQDEKAIVYMALTSRILISIESSKMIVVLHDEIGFHIEPFDVIFACSCVMVKLGKVLIEINVNALSFIKFVPHFNFTKGVERRIVIRKEILTVHNVPNPIKGFPEDICFAITKFCPSLLQLFETSNVKIKCEFNLFTENEANWYNESIYVICSKSGASFKLSVSINSESGADYNDVLHTNKSHLVQWTGYSSGQCLNPNEWETTYHRSTHYDPDDDDDTF